jgi:hypothetical protein
MVVFMSTATHSQTGPGAGFGDVVADLGVSSDGELTERFRELELQRRRVEAEMAAITSEVDRRGVYRADGHRSVSGWLRAHGSYAHGTVTRLKRLAVLVNDCGDVGDDLYAGVIGVDQAAELGRARANPRCGDQLHESVRLLLWHANRFGYKDFAACVQRWEMLADLDGAHADRGDAITARRAAVIAGADGVDVSASGGGALDAAEMAAIFDAFVDAEFAKDLTARNGGGEFPRTDAQRRYDALLAIMRTANTSPGEGTRATATLDVVSDLYTFEAALARHGLADEPTDLPVPDATQARCETTSGVPLLPDDVVSAGLGGWIRRVIVDSASVVTDLGHRRRCFTGAAAEAARLSVTTCEHDGCTIPETWAEIDHIDEWARHGGRTDQANAAIECGHHNRHKHRHGFTTRRDWAGRLRTQRPDGTWITPVGCDPPIDHDFRTDTEIADKIRSQLEQRWGLPPSSTEDGSNRR